METLEALLALVPGLRAQGIKRVRVGDVELEWSTEPELEAVPIDFSEAPKPLDHTKCLQCQVRPKGRLVKGLCRECALSSAGVALD